MRLSPCRRNPGCVWYCAWRTRGSRHNSAKQTTSQWSTEWGETYTKTYKTIYQTHCWEFSKFTQVNTDKMGIYMFYLSSQVTWQRSNTHATSFAITRDRSRVTRVNRWKTDPLWISPSESLERVYFRFWWSGCWDYHTDAFPVQVAVNFAPVCGQ